jgi:NADPH:quinone reductase-like Zn-dependent oxidoreductase
MANLAAVLTAAKAPLQVQEVEKYTPGPRQILVKNEAIALNPFEAKIVKLAAFPLKYPTILGFSYSGTVEAVGPEVTRFKPGDKIAASGDYAFANVGIGADANKYGGFQRYVLAADECAAKIPDDFDTAVAASLTGNLSTVVGLFNGAAGLDKPDFDAPVPTKSKGKVLVYGGSSSLGSLSVQYLAQAGYSVVTTTSPRNKALVDKLGAAEVVDHTQDQESLIKKLVAAGPYSVVVDSISLPRTVTVAVAVLDAQGGGKLYTVTSSPSSGAVSIPEGVSTEMKSWPTTLREEKNKGMLAWAYDTYFTQALAKEKLVALPVEKMSGGLGSINEALDKLYEGVSGVKLVVDPRE